MRTQKTKPSLPQIDSRRKDLNRLPLLILIVANLMVIVFALVQKWNVMTLMWVYRSQSMIIGLL